MNYRLWKRAKDNSEQPFDIEVDKHRGWFANAKWYNPLTWGTVVLGPNQVDNDWMEQQAKNPIDRADKRTRAAELAERKRLREDLAEQDRGASYGMHIAGQAMDATAGRVLNPLLTVGTLGKVKDVSQLITGKTTSENASEYGRSYADEFGEEAAREAEARLRLHGTLTHAAASLPVMLATGKVFGGSGLMSRPFSSQGLNAGTTQFFTNMASHIPGNPMVGKTLANMGMAAFNSAINDVAVGQMFGNLSDTLDVAGYDRLAGLTRIGEGMLRYSPVWSASGALAEPFLRYTPFLKKLKLADRLPLPGTGGNPIGPVTWRHPLTSLKNIGKSIGGFMLADAATGPVDSGFDALSNLYVNGELSYDPTLLIGNYNSMLIGVSDALAEKFSDTYYSMKNAGKADAALEAALSTIRTDPTEFKNWQKAVGPNATMEEVEAAVIRLNNDMREQDMAGKVLQTLDPDRDWGNSAGETYDQILQTYGQETMAKAKYDVYSHEAMAGGHMAPDMFEDADLSADQRRDLLTKYVRAMDDENGGTLVGQLFRGEKDILRNAMEKSEDVRNAVVAYSRGYLADLLSGKQDPSGGLSETNRYALSLLSDQELEDVLSPLLEADPDAIIKLQASGTFAAGSNRLMAAASRMVKDRLNTDGEFCSNYLQQYVPMFSSGAGLTDEDKQKQLSMLRGLDPEQMFSNMSDAQFVETARVLAAKAAEMGADGDKPDQELSGIMEQFTSAAKSRMWEMIREDPIHNLPIAAQLFTMSKGWHNLSGFLNVPICFYGTLTALLCGGAMLASGLADPEDAEDSEKTDTSNDASLLDRMSKQRQLLVDNYSKMYNGQ